METAGVASDQEPGGGNTNLSDKAYREIEEKMVMLVLRPGDIISETFSPRISGLAAPPFGKPCSGSKGKDWLEYYPGEGSSYPKSVFEVSSNSWRSGGESRG
jgi:hypothetical protein